MLGLLNGTSQDPARRGRRGNARDAATMERQMVVAARTVARGSALRAALSVSNSAEKRRAWQIYLQAQAVDGRERAARGGVCAGV